MYRCQQFWDVEIFDTCQGRFGHQDLKIQQEQWLTEFPVSWPGCCCQNGAWLLRLLLAISLILDFESQSREVQPLFSQCSEVKLKVLKHLAKFLSAVPFVSAALFSTQGTANATVILEGSDAIGYHCPAGQSGACTYADQVWSAIGGASAKPIAIVGTNVTNTATVSGTHAVVNMTDLSGAGLLSDYAAIYFLAAFGCCDSNPSALAGRNTDVQNYASGGGTVMIGDYEGDAGWDFLVGGSGHSAFVAGVGGALSGPGCTDGESVTAEGTANGFTQPPAIGCWTHQAYVSDHFAALGFTKSFFDADPGFEAANPGQGHFSSLLSNGVTLSFVPEPSSMALVGVALVGLGAIRRRKV